MIDRTKISLGLVLLLCLAASLLLLPVCKTAPRENEFISNNNSARFLFTMDDYRVIGEFQFFRGKSEVNLRINDTLLTGEVLPFGDVVSYSLIFQNSILKGNTTLKDNGSRQIVTISIPSGTLDGELTLSSRSASLDLMYGDVPVTGGWRYDEQGRKVTWQYIVGENEYTITITGSGRRAVYTFLNGEWDEESVLLFLLLEFIRQQ
jgi:hypothetical protein